MGYLKEAKKMGKMEVLFSHKMDDGYTYVISPNNTPGLRQDKYHMYVIKDKKIVLDIGTHPAKGGVPAYKKFNDIQQFIDKYDFLGKQLKKFLGEAKAPQYQLYHDTYTAAVYEFERYMESKGFKLDDEEMATKIGFGPRKPSKGKTNSFSIYLYKKGKQQRKMGHFQVYNRGTNGNEYELNAYVS